ncbi:NUDIX hydrolase, partial [Escherichia coli]|nr:NUDIX hydrolase [Escherichia coli]
MEEWDLLNENRELTGKTHIRGEKLAPGELHLVVHVCIFNEKGQLLIQKRQKDKEGWP